MVPMSMISSTTKIAQEPFPIARSEVVIDPIAMACFAGTFSPLVVSATAW